MIDNIIIMLVTSIGLALLLISSGLLSPRNGCPEPVAIATVLKLGGC